MPWTSPYLAYATLDPRTAVVGRHEFDDSSQQLASHPPLWLAPMWYSPSPKRRNPGFIGRAVFEPAPVSLPGMRGLVTVHYHVDGWAPHVAAAAASARSLIVAVDRGVADWATTASGGGEQREGEGAVECADDDSALKQA
eukprot:gene40903-22966_t